MNLELRNKVLQLLSESTEKLLEAGEICKADGLLVYHLECLTKVTQIGCIAANFKEAVERQHNPIWRKT